MDKLLQILQNFENRKLRRLAARKNRRIAQEELEKLSRNEEAAFEGKMNSLPAVYGRAFEMEGFDKTETQQEVDKAVQRRENYFNEATKIKAVIEEQEEIENMSTFRRLFGLKPKEDILFVLAPKRTLVVRIHEKLRKLFGK